MFEDQILRTYPELLNVELNIKRYWWIRTAQRRFALALVLALKTKTKTCTSSLCNLTLHDLLCSRSASPCWAWSSNLPLPLTLLYCSALFYSADDKHFTATILICGGQLLLYSGNRLWYASIILDINHPCLTLRLCTITVFSLDDTVWHPTTFDIHTVFLYL